MLDARVWTAGGAAGAALLIGATVALGVTPVRDQVTALQEETASVTEANDQLRVQNAGLGQRSLEIEAVRAEVDGIARRVPTVLDVERLSRELDDHADATGATLATYEQSPAVVVDAEGTVAHVRLPVSMTFTAPEESSLVALLELLQAGPQDASGGGHDLFVTELMLAAAGSSDGQDASLLVTGHLVLGAEPPAPPAAEDGDATEYGAGEDGAAGEDVAS